VIPKTHTLQYYKHSCQVLFSASADMFARKMTGSSVKHISINTPPEVEKETIDEFKKTMKDSTDILINKKLSTADVLVDHLMDLALIHYINMASDNKNLRSDYRSIYKISLDGIAADMAKDDRPFDMVRFEAHKQDLDTVLLPAGLQEIPSPLSVAALPTASRPPRCRAKHGAATGTQIARPCFHCNKVGHTMPNCTVKPSPGSLATAAKRKDAYILARDAFVRRGMRRVN
jgi:hypothetical protein